MWGGEVACRLVVGADGRASRMRRQASITLQRAPETHLIAGVLVDDLDLDPRRNVVATGEDVWMVTFPQGGGRARVYLCPGTETPERYAGPGGTERFLTASCFDAVPNGQAWAEAAPAGPCRTFPADDTWTDRPFAEGVVCDDPELLAAARAIFTGPDQLDPRVCTDAFRRRNLGLDP